jgi:hypothetical protein
MPTCGLLPMPPRSNSSSRPWQTPWRDRSPGISTNSERSGERLTAPECEPIGPLHLDEYRHFAIEPGKARNLHLESWSLLRWWVQAHSARRELDLITDVGRPRGAAISQSEWCHRRTPGGRDGVVQTRIPERHGRPRDQWEAVRPVPHDPVDDDALRVDECNLVCGVEKQEPIGSVERHDVVAISIVDTAVRRSAADRASTA